MMLIEKTSFLVADCSTILLLQNEKLDRQQFEAEWVVRPMQRAMINIGVVGLEL